MTRELHPASSAEGQPDSGMVATSRIWTRSRFEVTAAAGAPHHCTYKHD